MTTRKTLASAAAIALLLGALTLGTAQAQTPPTTPVPAGQEKTQTSSSADPAPAAPTNPEAAKPDEPVVPSPGVQDPGNQVYGEVFKALFTAFVLALVLESALAVLFYWRPFLLNFDGKGIRTPIAFAFALVLSISFKFDLITRLFEATTEGTQRLGLVGYILTALVLAGGSAGVNNLLKGLGFRQIGGRESVEKKPGPDQAWIAVSLTRRAVVGPVQVLVEETGGPQKLVGVIKGHRPPPPLFAGFLKDSSRFPASGGYAVPCDREYAVVVRGVDPAGTVLEASWGPCNLAKGAIIDVNLTV